MGEEGEEGEEEEEEEVGEEGEQEEEGAGRPCVLSRPFILFFCQFILLIRICQFFTP